MRPARRRQSSKPVKPLSDKRLTETEQRAAADEHGLASGRRRALAGAEVDDERERDEHERVFHAK
jgi:hypothetical protein